MSNFTKRLDSLQVEDLLQALGLATLCMNILSWVESESKDKGVHPSKYSVSIPSDVASSVLVLGIDTEEGVKPQSLLTLTSFSSEEDERNAS